VNFRWRAKRAAASCAAMAENPTARRFIAVLS